MSYAGIILVVLLCLVVGIGIFLLLRWLLLWYWRINEQMELLHHILLELRAIKNKLNEEKHES